MNQRGHNARVHGTNISLRTHEINKEMGVYESHVRIMLVVYSISFPHVLSLINKTQVLSTFNKNTKKKG